MKSLPISLVLQVAFCLLSSRGLAQSRTSIEGGLYYGKQGGFPLPSQLVFLESRDTILLVQCYFPLKGEIFELLDDTLYRHKGNENVFRGHYSTVSLNQSQISFNTDSSFSDYSIKNVLLEYHPEEQETLNNYRRRSKPWRSP